MAKSTTNDKERYLALSLMDSSDIGDSTQGLLIGLQRWAPADSSNSSYVQVHVSGIVSLSTGVDYCFVTRSEDDGTLLLYDWMGSNTVIVEPLL